jgi:hypothetical protein
MRATQSDGHSEFRVWITRYDCRRRTADRGGPIAAVALEPAEDGTMSAQQAAEYVRAFNQAALAAARTLRVVALPVTVRYDGDPQPGETLSIDDSANSDRSPD